MCLPVGEHFGRGSGVILQLRGPLPPSGVGLAVTPGDEQHGGGARSRESASEGRSPGVDSGLCSPELVIETLFMVRKSKGLNEIGTQDLSDLKTVLGDII